MVSSFIVEAGFIGCDSLASMVTPPAASGSTAIAEAAGGSVFIQRLAYFGSLAGIVAAYRYAMAPYLLAEHPELTAAEAIEELYAEDLDPHFSDLAQHYFAGTGAGCADRALDYAERAAERAAERGDFDEDSVQIPR